MPTYIYQTVPTDAATPVRRFELRQSMSEAALTHDPDSGIPVERVITGGQALITSSDGLGQPALSSGCAGNCSCH